MTHFFCHLIILLGFKLTRLDEDRDNAFYFFIGLKVVCGSSSSLTSFVVVDLIEKHSRRRIVENNKREISWLRLNPALEPILYIGSTSCLRNMLT